jgi:RNA polymerase sigma-70 factor (ECF subfamily)
MGLRKTDARGTQAPMLRPLPDSSDTSPDSDRITAEGGGALRNQLRDHVSRFCPRWLEEQADDITQIAWLRLHEFQTRNERNRDPGASLLARVAYCAVVDGIRRHRRRKEVPVGADQASVPTAGPGPAERAAAEEIGRAIRTCLARLLPNRRLAVTLYLQGHTGPETASVLGWSLKRAENMIFRGLADLRGCLARRGVTP